MVLSGTLFRHTLLQATLAALAAGGVLLALVWLLQSLRFLDFLVNKGLGLGLFLQLTGLLIPQLLTIILPLSILAGAIMVARRAQDDHETTVLLALGAAPLTMALPLLALGAAGVLAGFGLLMWLLPVSTTAFKDLQTDLRNRQGQLLLEEGAFNPLGDHLMVYVKRRLSPTSFEQLLVHDTRDAANPVTWYARFGELRYWQGSAPNLVLQQGMRQDIGPKRTSMLEFASYNLDLSTQLGAAMLGPRMKEVEERGLQETWQLANAEGTTAKDRNALKAEVVKRLTWPLLPIPLVLLAAAALLHPPRRRQSSVRGVVLAGCLGVVCMGGQFGWLSMAQGGNTLGLVAMAVWPFAVSGFAFLLWQRNQG